MSDSRTPKQPSTGASIQKVGISKRMSGWLANHQLVAVETLVRLLKNPLSSALTWLVIAIALTLPGALWMTLDNLEQLSGRFQESGRITVYLELGTSNADGKALSETIKGLTNVVSTIFINADQAMLDFKEHSGLQNAFEFLTSNPLPAVILVEPPLGLDSNSVKALLSEINNYRLVNSVQVDMAWVERLQSLLVLAERVIGVVGLLLALAIILVVGNTIRLAIAARVDEIRVVKLVGGTNAWVRRPFLYTGLWYGLVGGIIAWILLIICWMLLKGPVANIADLYSSNFTLKPLAADAALVLLLSAMFLGWLGAWWSVSRHLDKIEP